jgi:hypothetical protein
VAQPFKRGAMVKAPGTVDRSIGEFWVENPWAISGKHNLSNHERQRFFLNHVGRGFFDLSYLAGVDDAVDGRSVVAGDFRNNGQLDLIVRRAGGGPVVVYENQFPPRNYLEVSLRGRKSNRLGIGARLTVKTKEMTQVRELYPINSFSSQMPCRIHFGLGDSNHVEQLSIHWPSGHVQQFANLSVNQHIVVTEEKDGMAAVETVEPGRVFSP